MSERVEQLLERVSAHLERVSARMSDGGSWCYLTEAEAAALANESYRGEPVGSIIARLIAERDQLRATVEGFRLARGFAPSVECSGG